MAEAEIQTRLFLVANHHPSTVDYPFIELPRPPTAAGTLPQTATRPLVSPVQRLGRSTPLLKLLFGNSRRISRNFFEVTTWCTAGLRSSIISNSSSSGSADCTHPVDRRLPYCGVRLRLLSRGQTSIEIQGSSGEENSPFNRRLLRCVDDVAWLQHGDILKLSNGMQLRFLVVHLRLSDERHCVGCDGFSWVKSCTAGDVLNGPTSLLHPRFTSFRNLPKYAQQQLVQEALEQTRQTIAALQLRRRSAAADACIMRAAPPPAVEAENKEEEVLVASYEEGAGEAIVEPMDDDGAYRNSASSEMEAATPNTASQLRQSQRRDTVYSPYPPRPELSCSSSISTARRSAAAFTETFDERLNDALIDLENRGATVGDFLLHHPAQPMEGLLLGSYTEDIDERNALLRQHRGSVSSPNPSMSQTDRVSDKRRRRRSGGEDGEARRRPRAPSRRRSVCGSGQAAVLENATVPVRTTTTSTSSASSESTRRPSDVPVQLSRSDICQMRPEQHPPEDSQVVFFNH